MRWSALEGEGLHFLQWSVDAHWFCCLAKHLKPCVDGFYDEHHRSVS